MHKNIVTGLKLLNYVLPYIFSVVALFFSYAVYSAGKEDLHVEFMPILTNYESEIVKRSSGIDGPFFIDIKYKCVVFNNSDRPVSISSYTLFTPCDGGYVFYTNMNQGLFNRDGTKVVFPINLAPGEGKLFTQVIGLNVKKNIIPILDQINGSARKFRLWDLKTAYHDWWEKNGEWRNNGDGSFTLTSDWRVSSVSMFVIRFRTSRQNSFEGRFGFVL